jgi:hypothetical protein
MLQAVAIHPRFRVVPARAIHQHWSRTSHNADWREIHTVNSRDRTTSSNLCEIQSQLTISCTDHSSASLALAVLQIPGSRNSAVCDRIRAVAYQEVVLPFQERVSPQLRRPGNAPRDRRRLCAYSVLVWNVIFTANLECHLNVKTVALHARNAQSSHQRLGILE